MALTVKQQIWDGQKILNAMDRLKDRRVAGPAGARKKRPCTCGHTRKHHKKTGRCRGKILTDKQTGAKQVAGSFKVPARLVGVPASCPCDAGVRK